MYPVPAFPSATLHRKPKASRPSLAVAAMTMPLLSTLLLTPPAFAADAVAADSYGLDGQAVRDFRGGRHAAAFGRLARSADAGDRRAARIALLMVDEGPALFGRAWYASLDQRRRWTALAQRPVSAANDTWEAGE